MNLFYFIRKYEDENFFLPTNGISTSINHTMSAWTARRRITRIWFFNTSLIFANISIFTVRISNTFRFASSDCVWVWNQPFLASDLRITICKFCSCIFYNLEILCIILTFNSILNCMDFLTCTLDCLGCWPCSWLLDHREMGCKDQVFQYIFGYHKWIHNHNRGHGHILDRNQ